MQIMGKSVKLFEENIVRDKNFVPIKIFSEQSDSTKSMKDLNTFVKCLSKKLELCIDIDTVKFIASGVEGIVDELVRHVLNMDQIKQLVEELKDKYGSDAFINDIPHELLKVGSFYENTKNCFPDEFDFIFVILHAKIPFNFKVNKLRNSSSMYDNKLLKKIIELIGSEFKNILTEIEVCHQNENNILELTDVVYPINIYRNGPNITLVFRFQQYSCNTKHPENIHVDLTPAIKILDRRLWKFLPELCPIEEFRSEVKKTGSCLVVSTNNFDATRVCFTETEVRLMTKVLSDNHRELYKLLKYIINGKLSESQMKEICQHPAIKPDWTSKHWISSYDLKCIMILHHFRCQSDANMPAAKCLLKLLKWLRKRFNYYTEIGDHICTIYVPSTVSKYENSNDSKSCTRLLEMEKRHLNQLQEELKRLIDRLQRSDFTSICPLAEVHFEYLNRVCEEHESKYGTEPIPRKYHLPCKLVIKDFIDNTTKTEQKRKQEPFWKSFRSISTLKVCQFFCKRTMVYISSCFGWDMIFTWAVVFVVYVVAVYH